MKKQKITTTFALANGKKQTVFYGQDVRFETKNGKLKDYDPSLVKIQKKKSENGNDLKDYAYENEEGDKKHYLPKNLTEETPVLMENGQYQISFAPIYGQKNKERGRKSRESRELIRYSRRSHRQNKQFRMWQIIQIFRMK